MISRNLAIALLVSLGMHIFGMSAVTIITPPDPSRSPVYTRVDFLGPILRKTAFDIMLEDANPVLRTSYGYSFLAPESGYLNVVTTKRTAPLQEFPDYLERDMDARVLDFLVSPKAVPHFALEFKAEDFVLDKWTSPGDAEETRRVIYRPEAPKIVRAIYGDKDEHRVKVKLMVDSNGNVRKAEPVTTTGYPRLDIIASEFASRWIFEPREGSNGADEWHEVDVILKAED